MLRQLSEPDLPDARPGLSPEEGRVLAFLRQALVQKGDGLRSQRQTMAAHTS
jgi:hypothetical protein